MITNSSQTWANGVRYQRSSDAQTYTLPTVHPGVAQTISVQGDHLSAQDCQGKALEIHQRLDGFHKVLVASDAETGLETLLDPKRHVVAVATPEAQETQWVGPNTYETRVRQEGREVLDAQGNLELVRHLVHLTVTELISTNPTMPPTIPVVLRDEACYEDTTLAPGGSPTTIQVSPSGQVPVATTLQGGSVLAYPGGEQFLLYLN